MISDTESHESARKRPRRRFTIHDLEQVAELAAKRFTDTMACQVHGFNYDSFRNYLTKARNQSRFNDILTRTRANQLKAHIENIEDAALAKGVFTKPEWRASESLIKLKFPELYPQANQSAAPQVTIQIGLIHEQLKRVIGFDDIKEAALIEQPRIKMPVRNTKPSNGTTEIGAAIG